MTTVLYRRKSMTLLSLYNLDAITKHRSSSFKTRLEDLSNELLIDIFQYLSSYDLLYRLYNLNYRFNQLCEIQKLRLDISGPKRAFDCYCSHQQPFASQIYSLTLDNQYNRLEKFNRFNQLELFINLQRLSIKQVSSDTLQMVLSKLPQLPSLSYLQIYRSTIQSAELTTAIFQIRTLKQLILYSNESIILQFDPSQISPFDHLEYFDIYSCSIATFFEVLQYLGSNIKHFKIRLNYESHHSGTLVNPTIIDQWLSQHQISPSLQHLEIKTSFMPLENFHLLLRLFPHLTHLVFTSMTFGMEFLSPTIWHDFISTNLLHLKQLQFHTGIKSYTNTVVQCPSNDWLDTFQSLNSQWLLGYVVMDYNSLLKQPTLEVYTYPQTKRVEKNAVELYGLKRYVAPTVFDNPVNIDKRINYLHITLRDNQLSSNEIDSNYPKVDKLIILSQMTRLPTDADMQSRSILSDIAKSISNLSQITSLRFSSETSFDPSMTLTRRLLSQMPKITRLTISYKYLLYLLKSQLICQLLRKKISSLTIDFGNESPLLPDITRIFNVFSLSLRYLYFWIGGDFPWKTYAFILPIIFGKLGEKLVSLELRLWHRVQGRTQIFDEQFKQRLQSCITAQLARKERSPRTIEYRISGSDLSIRFET